MHFSKSFKEKPMSIKGLMSVHDMDRHKKLFTPNQISMLAVLSYIILGLCVFCYGPDQFSPLDAVYFSVQTLLTIGYGDVVSRNRGFEIFYVLLGAGIVGAYFGILSWNVLEQHEDKMKKRLAKVMNSIYKSFRSKKEGGGGKEGGEVDDANKLKKKNQRKYSQEEAAGGMDGECTQGDDNDDNDDDDVEVMQQINLASYDEEITELR